MFVGVAAGLRYSEGRRSHSGGLRRRRVTQSGRLEAGEHQGPGAAEAVVVQRPRHVEQEVGTRPVAAGETRHPRDVNHRQSRRLAEFTEVRGPWKERKDVGSL